MGDSDLEAVSLNAFSLRDGTRFQIAKPPFLFSLLPIPVFPFLLRGKEFSLFNHVKSEEGVNGTYLLARSKVSTRSKRHRSEFETKIGVELKCNQHDIKTRR